MIFIDREVPFYEILINKINNNNKYYKAIAYAIFDGVMTIFFR